MLLIAMALMIIAMGVAAPKMAQAIKRDRETEMIHRGVEYARAVKKFYKKFGRYPTSIEQLEKTNNIRFLRKRYKDPMSADGKWRLVRFGEVQLGQQGGGVLGGASGTTGASSTSGELPPVVSGALGQPQGGSSSSFGQSGSTFGQSGQSGTQQGGGLLGGSSSGQVFGGGAILGVASMSDKKGIHEFDKKFRYNQWLFVYDPNQDRGQLITGPYNPKAFLGQPNQVGTPVNQMNQSGGSFGNQSLGNQVQPPGNQPQGFPTQPH